MRFTFECGCFYMIWAEGDQLKAGLSCCQLHEVSGQKIQNILAKCPMLLTKVGMLAQPGIPNATCAFCGDKADQCDCPHPM